jgi:hypothetical protein
LQLPKQMPTFVTLHHNESHFIRFSFSSLFLLYFCFSPCTKEDDGWKREEWEVPSTVICNQGNGQSASVCETVAPTREAPMNISLAILYRWNVVATWTLTAKEPLRYPASPRTIRGRLSHTATCFSPRTPPPTQHGRYHPTNTPCSYLIHLPGDGQRSEATDPETYPHLMTTMISVIEFPLCDWVSHRFAMVTRCPRTLPSSCYCLCCALPLGASWDTGWSH